MFESGLLKENIRIRKKILDTKTRERESRRSNN